MDFLLDPLAPPAPMYLIPLFMLGMVVVIGALLLLAALFFMVIWAGVVGGVLYFWIHILRAVRRGEVDPEKLGSPLRAVLAGLWGLDAIPHDDDPGTLVRVPVPVEGA